MQYFEISRGGKCLKSPSLVARLLRTTGLHGSDICFSNEVREECPDSHKYVVQRRFQVNSLSRDLHRWRLRHWNLHLLLFWLALSLLCYASYVTTNEKFPRELAHYCVTYVTEQR